MPSAPLPSRNNDYAAPAGMVLDKPEWDAAMTDIGARLRAFEAKAADMDAVIAAGTDQALAMITENVAPLITDLNNQFNLLQTEAQALSDAYAAIISGNLAADHVVLAAIAGVSATNVQGAVAELRGKIGDNTSAISDNTAAIAANAAAIAAIRNVTFIDATADINLVAGKAYRVKAAATLTLPVNPASGDTIRIIDGEAIASGAAVIVARNGHTIMAASSDLTLDIPGVDLLIWWNGTDWRLF